MSPSESTAVLLLNVGSPRSPRLRHVASYLTQFLTDGHVLSLPWLPRQLLVRGLIVPLRAFKSAAKYRRVWTSEGSPLLLHSHNLLRGLQQRLPHMRLRLAMRYGEPSIASALDALMREGPPARLVAVPLFPHFSSATTGTGLAQLMRCMARYARAPELRVVEPLSALPAFHHSLGQLLRRHAESFKPEHVLFSFHGLPLSHVYAACGAGCRRSCQRPAPGGAPEAPRCYVHACHATSGVLASFLGGLPFSTAFQSRMRGGAWTSPFSIDIATALARRGCRRLLVACPSFVCDCLETLEEVGMEMREAFLNAGGEAFELAPCLNDEAPWVEALAEALGGAASALT